MFDRLIDSLGECLTPESAKRVLAIKADKKQQARIKYLGEQSNEGRLTSEEEAEYGEIIRVGTVIAILKSKARRFLANSQ
jgi:hypothetical protein